MIASSETILITTLAEYQTRFWIPVAQHLRSMGREVQLLAFDDRSAEMAQAQGVGVTNIYRTGLAGGAAVDDPQAFDARVAHYGLDGTNFLFSHERVTFGIRDGAALRRRFMIYSNAMERVLDDFAARARPCVVVQELGGFLSVIAALPRGEQARHSQLVHRTVVLSRPALLHAGQLCGARYHADAGGDGVGGSARLSRPDAEAARHRHSAKGPASLFRGLQEGRVDPATQGGSPRSCGISMRSASTRSSATICGTHACTRRWRLTRRGCGGSIGRCRRSPSSIIRCTCPPTWR